MNELSPDSERVPEKVKEIKDINELELCKEATDDQKEKIQDKKEMKITKKIQDELEKVKKKIEKIKSKLEFKY